MNNITPCSEVNLNSINFALALLFVCPQVLSQGALKIAQAPDDVSILVTSFGASDQSQCVDVSQTGGERPESCPSVEEAESLSFMAFNDQSEPLQGYGIGDSILNEDGECADLDAKYSTYYNGLEFWDHAWITQEDAQRLNIQVGTKIFIQEGACENTDILDSLSAITKQGDRIRVRMWPWG